MKVKEKLWKEADNDIDGLPADYQSYLDNDPSYEAWANEYDRQTDIIRQAKGTIPGGLYPLAGWRENC